MSGLTVAEKASKALDNTQTQEVRIKTLEEDKARLKEDKRRMKLIIGICLVNISFLIVFADDFRRLVIGVPILSSSYYAGWGYQQIVGAVVSFFTGVFFVYVGRK